MAKRRATVEVLPSAKRLIGSLRDLGYETAEAVADLVDNSIAAGARRVEITIHFDGGDSWIRIADDGHGMNGSAVTEAMKYGAERDYEDEDLGKFGLGLKTASMSQCRRLSVASRVSKSQARIEARQLDLAYVERTDSWRVLLLGAGERPKALVESLKDRRGTVVLWEDLDRILNYKNPGSEWARNRLLALAQTLDLHLGMVFHRFLAGEVPRRARLRITINGTPVEPWDPFARSEPHTEALKAHDFEIHTANGSGIVRLEPFVLPHKDLFSSDCEWQRLSGPNNWNRQQGFYIYRANRLIQSGGWSRMRTQDEHNKLARVGLLFSPDLDAAFGINVAKMRVILPAELKEQIKPTVDRLVKRAQAAYRGKTSTTARPAPTPSSPVPSSNPSAGGADDDATDGVPLPEPPLSGASTAVADSVSQTNGNNDASTMTFERVATVRRRALEAAAEAAKERQALERIVRALHETDPEVAHDLGF